VKHRKSETAKNCTQNLISRCYWKFVSENSSPVVLLNVRLFLFPVVVDALKKNLGLHLCQQSGKQLHKIDRCGDAPARREYPISNINASQTCN